MAIIKYKQICTCHTARSAAFATRSTPPFINYYTNQIKIKNAMNFFDEVKDRTFELIHGVAWLVWEQYYMILKALVEESRKIC